jgi:hypothetical protein
MRMPGVRACGCGIVYDTQGRSLLALDWKEKEKKNIYIKIGGLVNRVEKKRCFSRFNRARHYGVRRVRTLKVS